MPGVRIACTTRTTNCEGGGSGGSHGLLGIRGNGGLAVPHDDTGEGGLPEHPAHTGGEEGGGRLGSGERPSRWRSVPGLWRGKHYAHAEIGRASCRERV